VYCVLLCDVCNVLSVSDMCVRLCVCYMVRVCITIRYLCDVISCVMLSVLCACIGMCMLLYVRVICLC